MPSLKYARVERERRFLLDRFPDLTDARTLRITDRYVEGTRLRVRLVEEPGQPVVRKLGQKIRLLPPSTNAHTTMYLDEPEFTALCALPAAVLRKTRYVLDGWAFDEHGSGLLLAETESDAEPWFEYARDVTSDEAFTGRTLATSG